MRERQHGRRVQTRERAWQRRIQEAETDLFARARELEALNQELRLTRDQLALRALRDPLTDLLIRPVLMEQVERALSRTARHPHPVTVLFVDLDRLKQVNDAHGHAAGDSLIRCFAKQLQSSVRPGDAVARFGGDEFVVLLEDLDRVADAEAVAQRVLSAARDCPVAAGVSMRPSASVGVAFAWGADLAAEDLIAQADQAMYRAKRTGGGCYRVFDPVGQA